MRNLFLIICAALALNACKKSNSNYMESQGTITGVYLGPCPYIECGGIEITIKSDTTSYYLIYSSFSKLGITDSTSFPIKVDLTWEPDPFRKANYIIVSQLKVIK